MSAFARCESSTERLLWTRFVFRRFPKRVEFCESAIFQSTATGVDGFLDRLKSLHEFGGAAVEQFLSLKIFKAREIDDRKQQIANFFFNLLAALRGQRIFYFAHFLFDFGDDVLDVLPVETDARDFALDFVGFQERGEMFRKIFKVQNARRALFRFLDRLPLLEDFGAVAGLRRAEDVRMAAHELFIDGSGDGVEIEFTGFAGHLGVEDDLQEKIAKLILEGFRIARIQGVESFIAFFNEVVTDGLVRLLAVPRASARTAEARHDLEKSRNVLGLSGHVARIRIRAAASYGKEI